MEITLEAIISVISLLFGGSGIVALITWRYQRKKARAEAKEAEATAERAKYEAMQANTQLIKDIQNSYQQLTTDLKANLDTQQEYNEEQKQYIAELKEDRQHLRALARLCSMLLNPNLAAALRATEEPSAICSLLI